jgi:alkylation response protein AidB-like acyl-CoA dehydrogenase
MSNDPGLDGERDSVTERLPQALGQRVDIQPFVAAMAPMIREAEAHIEAECALPQWLVDELYERGYFHTLHPRELGGLELHPLDWLDLLFEVARIDGSVAWIGSVQCGLTPLLSLGAMEELRERVGERWIAAGSSGRIGVAYPVEGGYRVSGDFAFASGSPWATVMTALATVIGDDGEPVWDAASGGPLYVDVVVPKDEVEEIGGWNPLGLRGTASGQFRLDDVFVAERFTSDGMLDPSYGDRALFKIGGAATQGHSMVTLGCAQGTIDALLTLSRRERPARSWANRQARLGKEQVHQVDLAHADGIVRAARGWVRDVTLRRYDTAFTADAEARFALAVEAQQAAIYASKIAKQAVNIVFDLAGSDSVVRGRGIERSLRDAYTASQHELTSPMRYQASGQYYFTRDLPDGPSITATNTLLPPLPPRRRDERSVQA